MGLIKAFTSGTSQTLGDQFKEYITCDNLEKDVLVKRGTVHHGEGNRNPSTNVITNGSGINVPEGTAMIVIEDGKILDFCAEPGRYTFDKGSEPSIFVGGLGQGIINTIKTIGKRTTYGGQPAIDQRVYYVNLLAITGNKFGSPQPKKITDEKYGMLEVTFFGEYAAKVADPAILISNVVGSNAKDTIRFSDLLEEQFKAKFIEKMTGAITTVMRKNKIPFGDIGMYGSDISNEMNVQLDEELYQKYGMTITDVAIADINLTDTSMERVSRIDDAKIFSDTSLQSGLMATSSASALEKAAENPNGSLMGFMNMSMASNNGSSLLNTVNQSVPTEPTFKEPIAMPEPGTLFNTESKKEEVEMPQPTIKDETPQTENNQKEPVIQSQFCTNCGKPTSGGNFCGYCGAKLK